MITPTLSTTATRWSLELPRGRRLELGGRPRVMGVLNVTPDSFSDGGQWMSRDSAVDRARQMLAQGADLIDLGAESTRPGGGAYGNGAATVPASEEMARLLPVLEALRAATDAPLSVDTRKGEVAAAALAAGADLINDVSALADSRLAEAVADSGCPIVLMHSRGELATMQRNLDYDDLVTDIGRELQQGLERAELAGIDAQQIILDPGIGFAKSKVHNLEILRRLDAFHALGRPLLVGASRKSFIGELTGEPPRRRVAGSLAAAAWATSGGAAVLRVHDVAETVQFLDVWCAVDASSGSSDD